MLRNGRVNGQINAFARHKKGMQHSSNLGPLLRTLQFVTEFFFEEFLTAWSYDIRFGRYKVSCSNSFDFDDVIDFDNVFCKNFCYCNWFCFVLFCFVLFCFVLFCFVLVQFCFVLFLFCFVLFVLDVLITEIFAVINWIPLFRLVFETLEKEFRVWIKFHLQLKDGFFSAPRPDLRRHLQKGVDPVDRRLVSSIRSKKRGSSETKK